MKICRNVPLKNFNTFGLDYMADYMIHVKTDKELKTLLRGEIQIEKPLFILGGGSNILFTSDFRGTILKPVYGGIRIEKTEGDNVIISAGAGVRWDKVVEWAVNNDLGGLENLSLIPGNVGATPVQNIGAYGVEIKDSIEKVKTFCVSDGSIRYFSNSECRFEYRNSIFKTDNKGKYLVTRVYFRLTTNYVLKSDYGSLNDEIRKLGKLTLKNVRQAVINIRKDKLPDPDLIGNAGSFFKNPVVSKNDAENLIKEYPQMPVYNQHSGEIKLAAGWLIDQCGWKGKRIGNTGVHNKQALVLVNFGNATGKEIFLLSEEIKESVRKKFGIDLEREVEVIGTI